MANLASLIGLVVLLVDVAWCQERGTQWENKENQLVMDKLANYPPRKNVRPVSNPHDTIDMEMNFTITRLVSFDEENMMATIQGWRSEMWHDKFLTWDPEEYGADDVGVYSMRINHDAIWRPDYRAYNAIEEQTAQKDILMVAYYDGTVVNIPPGVYKVGCHWQLGHDNICTVGDAHCKLAFGTWTYEKTEVEMHIGTAPLDEEYLHDPKDPHWHGIDMEYYSCHPRWNMYNERAQLQNKVYGDYPGEYPMMSMHFCLHDARHAPGVERTDCSHA